MKKILLVTCAAIALASTLFVSCASNKTEDVFIEVPAEEGEK